MASRQEEKEQRRREREAREAAARKAAQRKRTLQIGGGAALVVAVVVAIVVVATVGGGSSSGNTASAADVAAKAKLAGCTYRAFPQFGREHTLGKVHYKSNPPTSGPHYPVPASDGVYAPGNEPAPTHAVHALEHGRVEFEYQPGTSSADIQALVNLAQEPFNGTAAYHTLVFQNNTNMPFKFAVVAWRHYIGCSNVAPASIEAMRTFRQAFTDKAPEQIPQAE